MIPFAAYAMTALGADPAPLPRMSVWDFAVKGGPTMIIIAICSLIALAIIVERLLLTRRAAVVPPAFMEGLRSAARDRSLDLCRASASPIANILAAAVRQRGHSLEAMQKAAAEAGRRELVRLKHRMRLLGALPQVATMLGLLGTILGMIKTFQAVAASGQSLGKTELLARGIFEAWANTAAGLLVAIPVLIAYHALLGRIDARIVELDRAATDWIESESQAPAKPLIVVRPSQVPDDQAIPVAAGA
jgi:biopolymer transport protein ExbB